jgi:hypothetical protein
LKLSFPVAASSPKTYKSIATMTDIKINGIKTIIHDTIDMPD